MKVTVLNADSGQTDGTGKVHALGLGWTTIQAPTVTPIAVVVIVQFDSQDEAVGAHNVALRLIDEDRQPVMANAGSGQEPLGVEVGLRVSPVPDSPSDGPPSATFVVNLGPGIQLEPKRHYRWQASVDGHSDDSWSSSFYTRPPGSVSGTPVQMSVNVATS